MKKRLILSGVFVFIAGSLYLSLFTVQEYETVIVTRFGDPQQTISEPGLYWKLPWILNTVNRIDTRIRTIDTGDIQFLLSDKNPLVLSCYAAWTVSDPLTFLQAVGTRENAENKLRDMISSSLGIILGEYRKRDLINSDTSDSGVRISEIEDQVLRSVAERAAEKYGIQPLRTGIRRMTYPTVVSNAVYERMKSERSKEAARIRAQGRIAANKIRAEADREAEKILAEAEKQSLVIRGEADRESMEILSSAYGEAPSFYKFTTSLDTYDELFDKKSTIILSMDSPLFRYLQPEND